MKVVNVHDLKLKTKFKKTTFGLDHLQTTFFRKIKIQKGCILERVFLVAVHSVGRKYIADRTFQKEFHISDVYGDSNLNRSGEV